MFFLEVTQKAALRWLREECGDLRLVLSPPPLPWERPVWFVGRLDGRGELRRLLRLVARSANIGGVVFHADHPQTERIGERFGLVKCGAKYFISAEGVEIWKTKRAGHVQPARNSVVTPLKTWSPYLSKAIPCPRDLSNM